MGTATTVDAWLAALPEDRRALLAPVVELVRRHLPAGYAEAMTWGMPTWEVPLATYPDTYNKKPLAYVSLAAQKQYNALYLLMAYADSAVEAALRAAYARTGKKLDMGKSCLRFKRLEGLHLEAVAAAIASTPLTDFLAQYEKSREKTKSATKSTKNTKKTMKSSRTNRICGIFDPMQPV